MLRAIFFDLIVLAVIALGTIIFFRYFEPNMLSTSIQKSELSSVIVSQATSTLPRSATSSITTLSNTKSVSVKKASIKATVSASATTSDRVTRIQDPYSTPPESAETINGAARAALVNILCGPQGTSSLNPISGSGVIIDPRGIILTNAHIAQYVLLSESSQVDLQCVIRTGSPAKAQWAVSVLYIPSIWVSQHASQILERQPEGTGEHDYALLYITRSVDGTQLPPQFPDLPFDTRSAIAFPGDEVLVASYPAELVGGIAAQYDLYADSSFTTIKQLLTFSSGTPDVVSLGGIIEAQEGSSGGAVVNEWGRLVALIATTSSGTTTTERDLRGIALSYINTDLQAQSGQDLNTMLKNDPATSVQDFSSIAAKLIKFYVKQLSASQ